MSAHQPFLLHHRADRFANGAAEPLPRQDRREQEQREIRLGALEDRITSEWLLHGDIALVRRGKKTWHVVRAH